MPRDYPASRGQQRLCTAERVLNRSLQDNGLGWKLMRYPLNTLNALAKMASYQLLCR